MESCNLKIKGMDCASCVLHVEKGLKKLKGVKEANLNFATESGKVTYDPDKVKEGDLLKAVKKAGYEAEIQDNHSMHHSHHKMGENHSAGAMALSSISVVLNALRLKTFKVKL